MTQTKKISRIIALYGFVGFVGIAMAFHTTLLNGFAKTQGDTGDGRFVNYVLEHSFQWIFNRNYSAPLWSPAFFFPFKNTLAMSENMWGSAPLYWIARVFSPPDTAYQIWMILCAFLCFLCCAIVLRSLRVSHLLSAIGGLLFGFGLVRIGRLFHSQLLPQFFTPIAVLLVWRFLQKPTPNRLRFALALIFLQVLSGVYLGWFLLFGLLIFTPFVFYFDRASLKAVIQFVQIHWKSTIITIAVWFAALFSLLSPYIRMSKVIGVRPFSEVETMLPRLASWLYPPPHTLWYSSLSPLSEGVPAPHEHLIFMGFTVFVLVGVAIYSLMFRQELLGSERAILVKACLITALVIFGLSLYLAPNLTLWKIVYRLVPGATAIRAVSRIALIVEFFVLVAGLLCLDSVLKRSTIKPKIAAAIAILIFGVSIAENWIVEPLAYEKASIQNTQAELGSLMNQGCDLAYVNLTSADRYVTQQLSAMWAGLNTKVPIVNGYSGAQPPTMPGSVTENLPFSGIMQWFQSVKKPPTGRFCLIASTDDPSTTVRQLEAGISLDSVSSNTQYFSRDRRYTAFVVPLPVAMPRQAYSQGIRSAEQPTTLFSDQIITLPVFVRNTSPITWVQSARNPIKLSYRWFSAAGTNDAGDGIRTEMPIVLAPGKAIGLNASIKAPANPGQYDLRLSLVHENVAWFMDQGAKSLDLPITVVRQPEGMLNGKPKP